MKRIVIRPEDRAEFRNLTDSCVGTGRVDLALHREYQEQLSAVQAVCHFKMIRGHGLFSDQMGIYQQQVTPEGEKRIERKAASLVRPWVDLEGIEDVDLSEDGSSETDSTEA